MYNNVFSINRVCFHEFLCPVPKAGLNNYLQILFYLHQDRIAFASQNPDAMIFTADDTVFAFFYPLPGALFGF